MMRALLFFVLLVLVAPTASATTLTSVYGPATSRCGSTGGSPPGIGPGNCARFTFSGGHSFRVDISDASGMRQGMYVDACSQVNGAQQCSTIVGCVFAVGAVPAGATLTVVNVRIVMCDGQQTTAGTMTLTTDGAPTT